MISRLLLPRSRSREELREEAAKLIQRMARAAEEVNPAFAALRLRVSAAQYAIRDLAVSCLGVWTLTFRISHYPLQFRLKV